MFLKIDDWLFAKVFQPFSDWFMDHYGRGPFWLAATSAYLIVATAVLLQIFSVVPFTINGLMFLIGIRHILVYDWSDKRHTYKRPGTANPDRYNLFDRLLRIAFFGMFIVANWLLVKSIVIDESIIIYLVLLTQTLGCLCAIYFEACETKPPAPPKKKEAERATLSHSAP